MPWLRFHAYGVGLPKTGTTSLSAMLTNYRSGHEAWLDFLAEPAVARVRGEIDDETFWETVRNRFVPLRAEMDCVTCHHLYVDVLQEKYPKAKFVVTYRDVRSWANSLLDLVMLRRRTPPDQRGHRSWYRSYGDWISEGTFSLDPADDGDDTAALPALMRSWATYMRVMPIALPAERTIWIKTSEFTARVPDLAEFLGIPVVTIAMDKVHSNATPASFDRFTRADRDVIDSVYAEHCADIMAEHFPEEHARFLDRPLEEGDDAWSDYSARIDAVIASALLEMAHLS